MNSDITEILKNAQTAPTGHAQLVESKSDDEMTVANVVKGSKDVYFYKLFGFLSDWSANTRQTTTVKFNCGSDFNSRRCYYRHSHNGR